MKKSLFLCATIIVSCLNFLFSQRYNEQDSLKKIIKILNNATYEDTTSSNKEFYWFHQWKVKHDTAFGKSASLINSGTTIVIPSSSICFSEIYFQNGKLIERSFIQTGSKSEILVLNKNRIIFQSIQEDGKRVWVSEIRKSGLKISKKTKRYFRN